MKRAPVLITAYNRSESLDKVLENIQKSNHSSEYSFFIHIDGANIYKDNDILEQKKNQVVLEKYKDSLDIVDIKKESFHLGLSNSMITSVSSIISKYGRIIVIEDDLLLSPDALDFVNDALDFYQNDMNIWSVSAWTPKLVTKRGYKRSIHFQYRGSSWCWGTWKNRWNEVDWDVSDYDYFRNNYKAQLHFNRGGYDLSEMLRQQMIGTIDSWAIRWVYAQNKKNMLTVYPVENRVFNIGIGVGKGTHTTEKKEQAIILRESRRYEFTKDINYEFVDEYKKFWGVGFKEWITKYYRKKNSECDRLEKIIYIMEMWRNINELGYSIDKYFLNRNYKTVAVYGYGKIGKHIEYELKESDIDLVYFIDRNKTICDGVRCLSCDDNLPKVDCVVITVVNEISDIRMKLEGIAVVKTILEVLKDI